MPKYIKYIIGGFANAFGSNADLYNFEKKGEITKRMHKRREELNRGAKEKYTAEYTSIAYSK